MPRPRRGRCVAGEPVVPCFKPRGIPVMKLEQVALALDEFEALRLADYERCYHDAAAARMAVSRPTFGRILAGARHKVADALVNGKLLWIEKDKGREQEGPRPRPRRTGGNYGRSRA